MNQAGGIIVKHTTDRMKAFVALSRNIGKLNASIVLTELLRHGVAHGLNAAIIQKLVAAELFGKYVEVAQGTPVKPGTDGRIEMLAEAPAAEWERGGDADGVALRVPRAFVLVEANAPVARRIPPVRGTDGMDVFGATLPAPPVKDVELPAGDGTAAAPDNPDLLIAARAGTLHLNPDGRIEVRPLLDINLSGGVDAEPGNIFFDGDLRIGGTVGSDAKVEVTGSLIIIGCVEAAEVICGGDLMILGEVSGGGRAIIECGGYARVRAIDRAAVVVEGDITVDDDIVDSDVFSKGALKARGIAGGSIKAARGVSAAVIGTPMGIPTVIDIGAAYELIKKCENIKSCINTQDILTDGYASELFNYVRGNMDEFGLISDTKVPAVNQMVKNLKDAVTVKDELEKDLNELEESLKTLENCRLSAKEIYPNVELKLGFSEQRVKEHLKDVMLKPALMKVN